MADMDKTTSEEKLLKLIEGAAKKPIPKIGIKQKPKKILAFKFNLHPKLDISNLNKALFAFCGLLTIIVLFNLVSQARLPDASLFLPAKKVDSSSSKFSLLPKAGFLSREEYLAEIKKRNVFLPFDLRESVREGMSAEVSELVKDLSLVGIIWSKNPEVMIESKRESRTMLLKKGDTFNADEIKVKEITKNSAVLEIHSGGEVREYELR
jgi:type II secretory pathway component PulC